MRTLVVLFIIVLLPVMAYALDVTQTGVNLHVTYTEPTVTENNTPLDDLASTTTTVKDQDGTIITTHEEPASSLSGGGDVAFDLVVDVPLGQKQTLTVDVTASDLVGNVSQPITSTVVIDREAPGVPQ